MFAVSASGWEFTGAGASDKGQASAPVIIFRYIARELLSVTVAVTTILLLVLISGRFVKFLAEAARGVLDPFSIFAIIGYRIPGFLELTLPLAFFLALLLTLGRLYVENEMSVLQACGVSNGKILRMTFVVATGVALLVGWLSLYVTPDGAGKADGLISSQRERGELDKLQPRTFYNFKGGRGVAYVDAISDEGELQNIFYSEIFQQQDRVVPVVVLAQRGHQQAADDTTRYLVLEEGFRLEGVPGELDYDVVQFEQFGTRLEDQGLADFSRGSDAIPTAALWQADDLESRAALQWRLSIPVLVWVVTLMALAMGRTNPRQGRFTKLLPAIMFYFIYLISLNAARGKLEEGALDPQFGMALVHLLFFAIALFSWLWVYRAPKAASALPSAGEVES